MAKQGILELTAEIVAAHVSCNNVLVQDLPSLVRAVYDALDGLGSPPPEAAPKPAVSIRSSVTPSSIACLDCGKRFKMIKRHLKVEHNLTPEQYLARWGLADDYPLVAPDYVAARQALAVKMGLGRRPYGKATGKK